MSMVTRRQILVSSAALSLSSLATACAPAPSPAPTQDELEPPAAAEAPATAGEAIPLPPPRLDGSMSVEEALSLRRSQRSYRPEPLSVDEVAQLLWAAQGITDPRGYRTAPSAGALYPLELYLVCGWVNGLEPAIYRYAPHDHALSLVAPGDVRDALANAALGQSMVRDAAIDLVFTAVYERTTGRYGARGHQYVHMEVGHAGQNVHLQAVALGLGTVVVGAFHDATVHRLLQLPKDETPLYIMPVSRPARTGPSK